MSTYPLRFPRSPNNPSSAFHAADFPESAVFLRRKGRQHLNSAPALQESNGILRANLNLAKGRNFVLEEYYIRISHMAGFLESKKFGARRASAPLLFAALFFISFCGKAYSIELIAQKSDTFIFEGMPGQEFSKSDFLAVAHVKGERAVSYIPFEISAEDAGINTSSDDIYLCSLTLFIKSVPLFPESNANESGTREGKLKDGGNNNPSAENAGALEISQAAENLPKYAEEKIDSAFKDKIRIAVYAITDEEAFEPNSKNFRVSWDGKSDAPAPKHNTRDFESDAPGLVRLGTIELDTANESYDDGDRIEFTSEELREFLCFAYGILSARGEEPKFKTSKSRIRRACLILLQEEGHSGIFFYSSDSIGDETDKEQSGDESAPNGDREARGDGQALVQTQVGEEARDLASAQAANLPPMEARAGEPPPPARGSLKSEYPELGALEKFSSKNGGKLSEIIFEKYVYKKGKAVGDFSKETVKDMRPRITFESFRRENGNGNQGAEESSGN